jgi:hypothetical protein
MLCLVAIGNPACAGPVATGKVYHYRAGLFRMVADNRGLELRRDVLGYASVPDCRRINSLVLARVGKQRGWFQVIDCSHPRDIKYQRESLNLVLEVNVDVAERGGWDYDYSTGRGEGKTFGIVYAFRPRVAP